MPSEATQARHPRKNITFHDDELSLIEDAIKAECEGMPIAYFVRRHIKQICKDIIAKDAQFQELQQLGLSGDEGDDSPLVEHTPMLSQA